MPNHTLDLLDRAEEAQPGITTKLVDKMLENTDRMRHLAQAHIRTLDRSALERLVTQAQSEAPKAASPLPTSSKPKRQAAISLDTDKA